MGKKGRESIYWDVYSTRKEAKKDYPKAKRKIEKLTKFKPIGYKTKEMDKPKKHKGKKYMYKLYIKVKKN